MTRPRRFSFAVLPIVLFGACSELAEHGERKTHDGGGGELAGGEGGASGSSAKPGAGGEDEGGAGGYDGGGDAGSTGGSGARGGSGKGGAANTGGSAGAAGTSGTGAGGAGGSGTLPPCTQVIELTATARTDVSVDRSKDPRVVIFSFEIAPNIGLASFHDTLEIQFWSGSSFDGTRTGTFSLGAGPDSNNATCSRCFLAYQDDGAPATRATRFFQTAGTLTLPASSQQLDGFPTLSYSDVTLREVTIDESDGSSTIVPDGVCLHLASGSFSRSPEWTCDATFRTDGVCDCGCGTLDPQCPDSNASSCDWCWCGNGRCPGLENPDKNWTCL